MDYQNIFSCELAGISMWAVMELAGQVLGVVSCLFLSSRTSCLRQERRKRKPEVKVDYFFPVKRESGSRAGLVQAVESYRLWPEGPGFDSRSPRIAQARVRLATDTLSQTPHRAGALCTGYAPLLCNYPYAYVVHMHVLYMCFLYMALSIWEHFVSQVVCILHCSYCI